MASTKYYAIQNGENKGVYDIPWNEFQPLVKGVSGVIYKSFSKREEAEAFVASEAGYGTSAPAEAVSAPVQNDLHIDVTEVFVDGSYNSSTNEYGYGVYMKKGKHERVLFGKGPCREDGRNVEGEVAGAQAALAYIKDHTKIKDVVLYHDYQGIGSWGDGDWKANKSYSKAYAKFVSEFRNAGLNVRFSHVDGHTGVLGNEYVDKIAKCACGISLTRSEKALLSNIDGVKGMPDYNSESVFDDDRSLSL